MIGCLRTCVRKQPIIALCFKSETVLKFYNLEARLTDLGSIKVTKSTQKYPMMPLDLHDSAILKQALLRTSGSTDDCGIDTPQQENWDSACIWSPQLIKLVFPFGSISISTVSVVILSDGGQASITPPEIKNEP